MTGIFGSLICSKTLMELNFGEVRRAQLAKFTLLTYMLGPLGTFQIFLMSVQMLKREWDAERNGKLSHLFIATKTATLVPEFAVEDLLLDRTETLVPAFTMEDLHLNRTL